VTYQVSPGVYPREIDLTGVLVAATSSIGAFSGGFKWGPVAELVLNTNELDLVNNYLAPDLDTQVDFFIASSFLSYTSALQVSRAMSPSALNATSSADATAGGGGTGFLIRNQNDYTTATIPSTADWVAKYPGAAGNGLRVYMVASQNGFVDLKSRAALTAPFPSGTTQLDVNIYSQLVKIIGRSGPNTTTYAAGFNAQNDELHIFVVDYAGTFSGTAGTVLEEYLGLSQITGSIGNDGTSLYYVDVINTQSQYIWWGQHSTRFNPTLVGNPVVQNANYFESTLAFLFDYALAGGSDGVTLTDADYINANSYFKNKSNVNIALLIVGAQDSTVALDAIQNIAEYRTDCVAFISPPAECVVGAADPLENVIGYRDSSLTQAYPFGSNTLGGYSSSYAVLDNNWKYMYNKYANNYLWIPTCGDIAGLCARTDAMNDEWWSPAGYNRGFIKNAIKLAYNPDEPDRDELYPVNINPIISEPGTGPLLLGDKTLQTKPSVFSRINVRRLFIVLETTITLAAKYSLFEFNDQYTQAAFVSLVEPFLRDVQGRRGIIDFDVICDSTNNTPQVINSNSFVGSIFVIPNQSINWIQLNFVAVNNGVQFSTITGQI